MRDYLRNGAQFVGRGFFRLPKKKNVVVLETFRNLLALKFKNVKILLDNNEISN